MTYLAQNSNSEIYVIVNRHIISNQSLGPMGFKEAVLVLELTTVISKKPVSTCQEKFHKQGRRPGCAQKYSRLR